MLTPSIEEAKRVAHALCDVLRRDLAGHAGVLVRRASRIPPLCIHFTRRLHNRDRVAE